MKIKSLVITVGSLGCAAFLASVPAQAGETIVPMAPIPAAGISNLLDPIETTVSVGYDSSYMFRGFNLGEEALWTSIDLSVPVGDFTVSAGAWYINPTDGAQNSAALGTSRGTIDDELDLYASIGTTMGAVDVAVGYTHYHYPENIGAGDSNEFGLNLGTSLGMFDLGLGYYYNLDIGDPPIGIGALDHYWELSLGTGWDLSDRVSLSVGVTAGWYSTDFSHLQYSVSMPIQIAENVVLEPYLAYLDNRNSGQLEVAGPGSFDNDDFFGGISLSVSF